VSPPVRVDWLAPSELRVGLGCMRLSTDPDRDGARAHATIAAAVDAGITVFDTAHAYGHGETELGHNERLLAIALRRSGAAQTARVLTKGGMTREGGGWVPDGRAKAIRTDCEASLAALDGVAIDTYLLHTPDPRTPWATSVRALAALVDAGLVARVGVCNVNRRQLDEALELAPIAAVQVALSRNDDRALRGGVVERCAELEIALIAHSPLGGVRGTPSLARNQALSAVATRHSVEPAQVALAWVLSLSPTAVAIPGARRPETARSAAEAATLVLTEDDQRILRPRPQARAAHAGGGRDVVVVMGIPGAGKTRVAMDYVSRGYDRLNRDERGGSLRDVAGALEEALAAGALRVVLDNTYLTRAARSYVLETADRHGAPVRCVWLNTPLAQAQVNLVQRLLERFGNLPAPNELRALSRAHEGVMAPTSQMRALRDLEPPSLDEGFAGVEEVPFERATSSAHAGRVGVLVGAPALDRPGWEAAIAAADPSAPHLLFDWRPDGSADALDGALARLRDVVGDTVEAAVCPHGGGPPRCWCRPPLPGLALTFAAAHGLEVSRSIIVGSSPAHRTLANALGARHIPVVA
jgi:aryl-alcohol dehydrogenase-like predicted oxidoreductase/predicted kinase